MAVSAVVDASMSSKMGALSELRVGHVYRSSSSVCSVAWKLWATELSRASPTVPMELTIPELCRTRLNSAAVYWDP